MPEEPRVTLLTDKESTVAAADDYGRVAPTQPPYAVVRPTGAADVAEALRLAAARALPVAVRGRGRSVHGRTLAADGIVIDMSALSTVHEVGEDRVTVDAGAPWSAVVDATLEHGLTPAVLTDFLSVSVGGTLSFAGLGSASHRHGAQTDQVLELEVVTGDGRTRICSRDRDPELFHAVLGGLGQVGVITKVTLRLIPAPQRVRLYRTTFDSADDLVTEQGRLLRTGAFDHLEGWIPPGPDGWLYAVDAAVQYDPARRRPDDEALLALLNRPRETVRITDTTYRKFLYRLGAEDTFPCVTTDTPHAHPWFAVFLPPGAVTEYVERLTAEVPPSDMGAMGTIEVYPLSTERLTTPLFRMPEGEPVVFMVAFFPCGPEDDPDWARRTATANRTRSERARALGGTSDPVGAVARTAEDWSAHFGPQWPRLTAAMRRYDPDGVLRRLPVS
jgi:FAD/FMN-containing dehydrogenase